MASLNKKDKVGRWKEHDMKNNAFCPPQVMQTDSLSFILAAKLCSEKSCFKLLLSGDDVVSARKT